MVIISSFYNEEYLLPWWLEHHKKYFDHGFLINYHSTDKSVDIIKKICPTWEVIDTKNKNWTCENNDQAIVEGERRFDGYKMFLTTTEFLDGKIPDLPKESVCYAVKIFRLVDNEPNKPPMYNKPLIEQKRFGYWARINENRHLHNYHDGMYVGLGRHKTAHLTKRCPILRIFKCVYSPWTEEFIQRKLSMKKNRDPSAKGGYHHWWNRDKLEKEHKKALEYSYTYKQ